MESLKEDVTVVAVLPAGGNGNRLGSSTPKQVRFINPVHECSSNSVLVVEQVLGNIVV